MNKKIISAVVAISTLLSGISAFAQYPEATVKEDGTVIYGPWGESGQPQTSISADYPSKLHTFGNNNDFMNKYASNGKNVTSYSNDMKCFEIYDEVSEKTRTFVLLDKDADGNYFVVADNLYGTKTYDLFSRDSDAEKKSLAYGTWIYDPENENSVAYWLNNDFLTSGNGGQKLPQVIIDNLVERDWAVEGVSKYVDEYFYTLYNLSESPVGTSIAPYTVTQKVSLLSTVEYYTYWQDLSPLVRDYTFQEMVDNAGTWSYGAFMMRSMNNNVTYKNGSHPHYIYVQTSNGGKYGGSNFYNSVGIRPCFFLDKDFFGENAVGTTNLGADVIAEIKSKYARAELSELYTDDTLTNVFGYSEYAPQEAQDVSIKGSVAVGETLSVEYTYEYEEGTTAVEEGDTKFQWYVSDDGENFEPIEGATGKTFTITSDYANKYFSVSVKCADADGNFAATAKTGSTAPVREAQSISATGTTTVTDSTVNASYTFTTPQSKTFSLIIAIYNNSNKLISVKNETKTVANGESITSSLGFGTGTKAKVYAIDDSCKPYFMEEVTK